MKRILGILALATLLLAGCCPPKSSSTLVSEPADHPDQPTCDRATRLACDELVAQATDACAAHCGEKCESQITPLDPPELDVVCELFGGAPEEQAWRGTCTYEYECECRQSG